MRVDAISARVYSSPVKKYSQKSIYYCKSPSKKVQNGEIMTFAGNNVVKGVGIGAIVGLAAMGAIAAISGGVATPFAYCLYAASFGTAGGIAAKAYDETEREQLQTAVQTSVQTI